MIDSFSGEYSFMSNFYYSEVEYEGVIYPTVEHAFQSAKTSDMETKKRFLSGTPSQAKWRGKRVSLRPDWEIVKIPIMYVLVKDKFTRNAELKQKLLNTGDEELIEGNHWGDRFWGKVKGSGRNELGKILMQVRSEFKTIHKED